MSETSLVAETQVADTETVSGEPVAAAQLTGGERGCAAVEDSRSATGARRALAAAVEAMERETEQLRQHNCELVAETDRLRRENALLTDELQQVRRRADEHTARADCLERDLERVALELEEQRRACHLHSSRVVELEEKLRCELESRESEMKAKFLQQQEEWAAKLAQAAEELNKTSSERDTLRQCLERRSAVNAADFEVLHQLESAKRDGARASVAVDRLLGDNQRLTGELRAVEQVVAAKEVELRNARTRHVLLTTQFNSLMEENSRLKQQRRVRSVSSLAPNAPAGHVTTTGLCHNVTDAAENCAPTLPSSNTMSITRSSANANTSPSLMIRQSVTCPSGLDMLYAVRKDAAGSKECDRKLLDSRDVDAASKARVAPETSRELSSEISSPRVMTSRRPGVSCHHSFRQDVSKRGSHAVNISRVRLSSSFPGSTAPVTSSESTSGSSLSTGLPSITDRK